jgi:8-oxo-dGTP pyrophosphatase MutT (NUDIX family)
MINRRIVTAAIALVLVLQVACTAAAPEYEAAGVIAYTRVQERTYVLLADHRDSDRGWASFGGHREEGETLAAAASREFREETRCVYGQPLEADLAGEPTVSRVGFLTYVVEVPFVSAHVFESRAAPPDCRGPQFDERGPWIWVPLAELTECLERGDPTRGYRLPESRVPEGFTVTLWSESATILERAIAKGLLE